MDISTIAVSSIPLQELPKWSPWPARLLGQAEWKVPERTVAKVDSEYDKDEYLRCLTWAEKQTSPITTDDVRHVEFRIAERKSFCVSQKENLFEIPADRIISLDEEIIAEAMAPLMSEVDTVVELGCGYGINLWALSKHFPEKKYFGGEYSQNAVKLAGMLYKDHPNIQVQSLNFYDSAYDVLEKCKGSRVLLFTRHAIEQLPTAAPLFNALTQYFDRIAVGVHLEVAAANYTDTLFGLMRKRYIEINDYNRDLLQILQSRADIVVEKNEPDIVGVSPLNPTSHIVWRPKA